MSKHKTEIETPERAIEHELDDAELEQVSGGGLLSSPLGTKLKNARSVSWSGTPYQPEEDVEAY